MLRPGGVATIVGMIPIGTKIELRADFMGDCKIQGTSMGGKGFHVDTPRLLEPWQQGRLNLDMPIWGTIEPEEINAAFAKLKPVHRPSSWSISASPEQLTGHGADRSCGGMRARHLIFATLLMVWGCIGQAAAQSRTQVQSRFFISSDGVRLHFLEAGPRGAHILVFVPGWTMPAWIWTPQLAAFSHRYHVIAFDPRGQGDSDAPSWGYDQDRRARDIADLLTRLAPMPAVIVGWSLGVLDTLAYLQNEGDMRIAGLVLVDNSVGEEPAPVPVEIHSRPGPPLSRPVAMHRYVAGMFLDRQPTAYIDRLTAATLRTPKSAAQELLSYPVPRSYWREAIYSTRKPVLYIVRPHLAAQAANLRMHRPNTETAVFANAGHALFIDDAARFDALVASFIESRIWP